MRWGCVVDLPGYGTLKKAIPDTLHALEVVKISGKKDGLLKVLSRGNPGAQACGLFCPSAGKMYGRYRRPSYVASPRRRSTALMERSEKMASGFMASLPCQRLQWCRPSSIE